MSKQYALDSVLNQPKPIAVGDRKFYSRVLLIREEMDWAAVDGTEYVNEQLAMLAGILNRRKADKGEDISPEWIAETLSFPEATALMTILRTGSVPGGDEGKD